LLMTLYCGISWYRRHGGGPRRLVSWTLRTFTSTRRWTAHASEFHDSRTCVYSAFQYDILIYIYYVYIYSFRVPGDENALNRHVYAAHFRYRSDDERLVAYLYVYLYIYCVLRALSGDWLLLSLTIIFG